MAKKKGLFDDLFIIFMLIAIGYTAYRSIMLSGSHNLFKELQDSWLVFLVLSGSDFLVIDTLYRALKKDAQRHGTARPPKAGTNIKRILGFLTRALVPYTIALTALMTIYFFIVFIASAFLLTLSKSLMLYDIFITTALMYIVVIYYGIEVWRYKKAQRY